MPLKPRIAPMGSVITANFASTVIPDNANNLPNPSTVGLYLGASGNVRCLLQDSEPGEEVTFTGLAAGVIHPISVKRVYATGTTATGILAVY